MLSVPSMRFYYLLLLLLMPAFAFAQAADTLGVVVHADPRLALLFSKKHETGLHGIRGSIRSTRGFRVQIYNGNSRAEAQARKIDFIRRFPNVRSYLSYIAPSYRLKVGDFKTRADAFKLYNQISSLYSPCMVVPDIVEINTLRDDD
jgi:hypothetical protein